jgi:putative ABC transport system substrate-binding protein
VWRVGVLILGNADAQSFGAELREGLRKSGYIEGQNIEYLFRSADNNITVLSKLAAELVVLKVDVLVALYTPCALAAQKTTRDIPIVTVSGDPVGLGLVASLAQPGGNITGISLMAPELHGKCVELFSEIASCGLITPIAEPFDASLQRLVPRCQPAPYLSATSK